MLGDLHARAVGPAEVTRRSSAAGRRPVSASSAPVAGPSARAMEPRALPNSERNSSVPFVEHGCRLLEAVLDDSEASPSRTAATSDRRRLHIWRRRRSAARANRGTTRWARRCRTER